MEENMKEEYEIGTVFVLHDKFYRCMEDKVPDLCPHCAFFQEIQCSRMVCDINSRKDKKSVHFISYPTNEIQCSVQLNRLKICEDNELKDLNEEMQRRKLEIHDKYLSLMAEIENCKSF